MDRDAITDAPQEANSATQCGTATLVGPTNAGKSTLLNALIGTKLAIVAPKPQTTRHRILGICTDGAVQTIWVDTPGFHRMPKGRSPLNRRMLRSAREGLEGTDVAVLVLDCTRGIDRDAEDALERMTTRETPWLIALNKIDNLPKAQLFELAAQLGQRFPSVDVVPVSALRDKNLDSLRAAVSSALPAGPHRHAADDLTDQSARQIVAEFVREKLVRALGQELPYQTAVQIDEYEDRGGLHVVHASILVERDSQKGIVVGKGGRQIREIGSQARADLEAFFGVRFHLELHVKQLADWSQDENVLESLERST